MINTGETITADRNGLQKKEKFDINKEKEKWDKFYLAKNNKKTELKNYFQLKFVIILIIILLILFFLKKIKFKKQTI